MGVIVSLVMLKVIMASESLSLKENVKIKWLHAACHGIETIYTLQLDNINKTGRVSSLHFRCSDFNDYYAKK